MKYITLLCDGMADIPIEKLNGKTPMEVADKPNMDSLAKDSEIGMVRTIPVGMDAGSDVANLSVIGYNPKKYYSGRSPLEALSMGIAMDLDDISFRCNLVTLSEEQDKYQDKVILDNSASDISTAEATVLIRDLVAYLSKECSLHEDLGSVSNELSSDILAVGKYEFYTGLGYRHILIERKGDLVKLAPPHDILQKIIKDYLPSHLILRNMMVKSYDFLNNHPVNIARRDRGLNPANSIWFWGSGTKPTLPSFMDTFGLKGIIFSATDLLKGIARGLDMDILTVSGANGGLDTNYEGIANASVKALVEDGYDFVYLHMEAPDELSHQGDLKKKILAIEYIDERILPIILRGLKEAGEDFRILILPDHATPISLRTHTADPVPYMIYDSRMKNSGCRSFTEKNASSFEVLVEPGHKLVERFFVD